MSQKIKRKTYSAWMAVRPKTLEPWSEPWVYIRKTKPKEIELSGFKAVRVKIIVEVE